MAALGTVKGNVVVLDEDVAIPEGSRVELRLVGPDEALPAAPAFSSREIRVRVAAARARFAHLTPEERAERLDALHGIIADAPGSVDDFIRRKQEDIEWENRRWKDENS